MKDWGDYFRRVFVGEIVGTLIFVAAIFAAGFLLWLIQ